ncbi:L,D-transpeptidase family protein [Pelagibacterium xiamenense]|uniref:L,D-transpeptidase family protein n=1 Tax=Pelagibacterium xiamenense TaxID=2901140 RepID=UPI001E511302|nr:L,D-transpeptidase family protein [Pelagibacterium xiamenense]
MTRRMVQNSINTGRRKAVKTLAAFAAGAALPAPAMADSILGSLTQRRILSETDREANSRIAMDAIGTTDPIVSLDTEYNLQRVADYYQRLVDIGGWPEVPTNVYGLILGNHRKAVRDLRVYLTYTGDLSQDAEMSEMFDAPLDVAVRGFQARHGLQITGKVDEATYWAMAVPTHERLRQLNLNLERVRGLGGQLTDRYVNVNIPAAAIEAVEGGAIAQRHTAIVGRIDRQTPILKSRIHQINFNPYWTVPKSIIERDITRLMQENPNYLTEYNIRIFDGSGNEVPPSQIDWTTSEAVNYTLRQDPGVQNSMGNVKINFHNPYAVYLHDTPQQDLFSGTQRFHSSGCVRVSNVDEFVAWILRDNGYDIIDVNSVFASGERLDESVESPVPIFTTYFTAWANRNGVVSFRDDVYDFDATGRVDFPELV